MKCCPGWASAASITMWYSVTAAARLAGERSARSSSAIVSRRSKILRNPDVSCGLVPLRPPRGDVRGEVVRDGVLAPEEQAVVPQRRLALELGEVLAPLSRVLGEVELCRPPVAALPARVQVGVGD